LLDAASATVVSIGSVKNDDGTFYVGLGSYLLLDGPLVHLLHGHGRSALRSLGLRTGLGIGTGLLAAAVGALYDTEQVGASGRGGCGTCADVAYGAAAGLANGLMVATILDVALLGFERKGGEAISDPRASASMPWLPIAGLVRDAHGLEVRSHDGPPIRCRQRPWAQAGY
jgi:hypothetical protein